MTTLESQQMGPNVHRDFILPGGEGDLHLQGRVLVNRERQEDLSGRWGDGQDSYQAAASC